MTGPETHKERSASQKDSIPAERQNGGAVPVPSSRPGGNRASDAGVSQTPAASSPAPARSLQRRLQEAASTRTRVRSQPLAVQPILVAPVVAPEVEVPRGPWRWTPLAVGLAALAWLAAVALLVTASQGGDMSTSSPRTTLAIVWGIAALMTFVPLEFRLGLPGLTWQGLLGCTLLGYTLAFVPPPTGWLLDLPDLPVYLLFFVGLFHAGTAIALPFSSVAGQHFYARRMHQLDLRRARRQAYEVGLLLVALTVLAALRVLSPLTGLLLVAVFVLVEALLLSQVAPDG